MFTREQPTSWSAHVAFVGESNLPPIYPTTLEGFVEANKGAAPGDIIHPEYPAHARAVDE